MTAGNVARNDYQHWLARIHMIVGEPDLLHTLRLAVRLPSRVIAFSLLAAPAFARAPGDCAISFLPRIKIPTIMLNAKYDQLFPTETSQEPFFRLLGSPPDRKRYVVYEGGHILPRAQLIRESLDWLGQVPRAGEVVPGRLQPDGTGRIHLRARAWAVRGVSQ